MVLGDSYTVHLLVLLYLLLSEIAAIVYYFVPPSISPPPFIAEETESRPRKSARLQARGLNVSEIKREYYSVPVHGIIVRVSRVHKPEDNPTNKYFQADITDGKKTLRFKCYDTHLRSTMEELCNERKGVTIEDCRVKQSTRRDTRGDFELSSNPDTKVVENPNQDFAIPADKIKFFTHTPTLHQLQELKDLQRDEHVTVRGKIVSIERPVEVEKNTGEKLTKQNCWLADQSMRIRLEIWEEEIGTVEAGSSYCFIDVQKKEFSGDHFLSTIKNGEIIEIESIGDNLSTETIPNTNGEIHGEISAVEKIEAYKECTSEKCKGKVNPQSRTMGRCNKCKRTVKLSKCETSIYAKFTVQETASKKAIDVTAFNQRVLHIIDKDALANLSESDIESMLMDAEPATFVINQEKVVVQVKRADIDRIDS